MLGAAEERSRISSYSFTFSLILVELTARRTKEGTPWNLPAYYSCQFALLSMDVEMGGDTALFRPAKRRKFQRPKRANEDQDVDAPLASPDKEEQSNHTSDAPALTEILKLRKANRNRRQGIEFSTAKSVAEAESSMSDSLTTIEPPPDRLRAISDRFVGHTGQVVDVDKHMFVLSPGTYYLSL